MLYKRVKICKLKSINQNSPYINYLIFLSGLNIIYEICLLININNIFFYKSLEI
jgi:hypothetical protein